MADLSFDEQVALLALHGWVPQRLAPHVYPVLVHPGSRRYALRRRDHRTKLDEPMLFTQVSLIADAPNPRRQPESWAVLTPEYIRLTLDAVLEEMNHG